MDSHTIYQIILKHYLYTRPKGDKGFFRGAPEALQAAADEIAQLAEGGDIVWSTIHANLQWDDREGNFVVDMGPLGAFGPIVLPGFMEEEESAAVLVCRIPRGEG